MIQEAALAWLRAHGVYTGPKLYHDSLQMVMDRMEALQPRGHGPDPLAERYPLGRDVVEAVEWRGRAVAPDLVGDLQRRLRDQH